VDTLDAGMIHDPGGMEQDGVKFHHTTQCDDLNLRNNLKLTDCLWRTQPSVGGSHL
jgi:hypothetical protein